MTSSIEVATGGDPAGALLAAIGELRIQGGGVYRMSVGHDDGCPCVDQQKPMKDCTCEILRVTREQLR